MGARYGDFALLTDVGGGCDGDVCEVGIRYEENDNEITLLLDLDCAGGFCGVLFGCNYNAEAFSLNYCQAEAEGMIFSYLDEYGAVCLLLDGTENCTKARVSLCFKKLSESGGFFFAEVVEAYRLSESGEIVALTIDMPNREIIVEERKEPLPVCVLDASLEASDSGELCAVICGEISDGCFALGVKVFAIELESGQSETVYIYNVADRKRGGRFELRATLGLKGKVSLVVTPLAYSRETAEGEKRVFVFLN